MSMPLYEPLLRGHARRSQFCLLQQSGRGPRHGVRLGGRDTIDTIEPPFVVSGTNSCSWQQSHSQVVSGSRQIVILGGSGTPRRMASSR
jgi:hypothetical protein